MISAILAPPSGGGKRGPRKWKRRGPETDPLRDAVFHLERLGRTFLGSSQLGFGKGENIKLETLGRFKGIKVEFAFNARTGGPSHTANGAIHGNSRDGRFVLRHRPPRWSELLRRACGVPALPRFPPPLLFWRSRRSSSAAAPLISSRRRK